MRRCSAPLEEPLPTWRRTARGVGKPCSQDVEVWNVMGWCTRGNVIQFTVGRSTDNARFLHMRSSKLSR